MKNDGKLGLVTLSLLQINFMKDLYSFIQKLPKAELQLHIKGAFEPELMFELARRNNLQIPFYSAEEVKAAFHFNNLQEFFYKQVEYFNCQG